MPFHHMAAVNVMLHNVSSVKYNTVFVYCLLAALLKIDITVKSRKTILSQLLYAAVF